MDTVGIRDAARRTKLSATTLRYYEQIGLIVDVARDEAGYRAYTEANLGWLEFLNKLRRTGMHIRDMVTYAELLREGTQTATERADLLIRHRDEVVARIAELNSHLDALNFKIQRYQSGEFQ